MLVIKTLQKCVLFPQHLPTARTIAGNSFNGTDNISIDIGDLANVHGDAEYQSGQLLDWVDSLGSGQGA